MAASSGTDSTHARRPFRATHAWALALTGLALVAIILALALVGGTVEESSSRAITDIELADDATISPTVVTPRFRPVLRRVVPAPAAAPPDRTVSRTASPQPAGGGTRTTRPPGNGGGNGTGGGATPTPTSPTPVAPVVQPPAPPAPAVPVVTLPPNATGPVGGLPSVAVGPTGEHVNVLGGGESVTANSGSVSVG